MQNCRDSIAKCISIKNISILNWRQFEKSEFFLEFLARDKKIVVFFRVNFSFEALFRPILEAYELFATLRELIYWIHEISLYFFQELILWVFYTRNVNLFLEYLVKIELYLEFNEQNMNYVTRKRCCLLSLKSFMVA